MQTFSSLLSWRKLHLQWYLLMEFICLFPCLSDAPDHKSEAPRNGVQVLYDCWVDPPFVGFVPIFLFALVFRQNNYSICPYLWIVDMQSHGRILTLVYLIASSSLTLRNI